MPAIILAIAHLPFQNIKKRINRLLSIVFRGLSSVKFFAGQNGVA